jgi:hypothetical protein
MGSKVVLEVLYILFPYPLVILSRCCGCAVGPAAQSSQSHSRSTTVDAQQGTVVVSRVQLLRSKAQLW